MSTTRYPTDLTDAQWTRLAPLLPAAKPGGRPCSVDVRAVCDALFYLTRSGYQWRRLPADFPSMTDRVLVCPSLAGGWHLGTGQ